MLKKIKFNVFLMLFLVSLSTSFFPLDIKISTNFFPYKTGSKLVNKLVMKNGSIVKKQKNANEKMIRKSIDIILCGCVVHRIFSPLMILELFFLISGY